MPRILIHFTHGLGDAVQLTCVFRHLQKYRPDWELYLQARRGKHSVGNGYCRRVWHDQEPSPDHAFFHQVFKLAWWENYNAYADCPNTKVTNCLREVFRIQPDPALLNYKLHLGQEALDSTAGYLEKIGCRRLDNGRFNAVVLHYQGNTSTHKKNLSHEQAALVCETVIAAGFVPVILDWDRRSPLPDGRRIFCPGVHAGDLWGGFGSGDAERITALISQASLFAGIDSGPQKCAGATDTPAIGLWTSHHPIQFMDLCPNFLHLVPANHETIPPMQNAGPRAYFHENYRYRIWTGNHDLTDAVLTMLGGAGPRQGNGLVRAGEFWVREDNVEQDLVVVRDVHDGDCYRTCLLGKFAEDEVIVDVGAHIGAFAKLWHKRNARARIICVEACPENLECLRANVGDFATVIQAACTYEPGELALLNAVRPNCESTGGSTVLPADKLDDKSLHQPGYQYWHDRRPLCKITLEELMDQLGVDHIDLLKLDCEGSEFSILEKTPSRSRIRFILGEYHGQERWDAMRARVFHGWDYGHMSACWETGLGNFHLCNQNWPPQEIQARSASDGIASITPSLALRACDLPTRPPLEIQARSASDGIASITPSLALRACDLPAWPPQEIQARSTGGGIAPVTPSLALRACDLPTRPPQEIQARSASDGIASVTPSLALRACDLPTRPPQEIQARSATDGVGATPSLALRACDPPSVQPMLLAGDKVLRLALPAGIGDAFWCLLKVGALCRREGAGQVDIEICGGPPHRSREFLERFDFVRAASYSKLSIVETQSTTPEGAINYAPSQPRWHNRFDWMLQANGHLERGRRIEDWLPDLEIDWNVMDRFRWPEKALATAETIAKQLGAYCVFYTGPEIGNTKAGHNRNGLWRPADWVRLAVLARQAGLQVIFAGAAYDRAYLTNHVLPAGLKDCHDFVGAWEIEETLAVIRGARFHVGFQSGLGIVATFLGVPTAMFWRPHGDSLLPDKRVTFREEMATAWVPPEHLASGRYLPCIYGRSTPEGIMEHRRIVWENLV